MSDASRPDADEEKLSPERRSRFYEESKGIVRRLAHSGLPRVTHHLVELLDHFSTEHPEEVFLSVAELIRAGQPGGYQYESLAARRVVAFVERYLAEYRWLFRQNKDCRKALVRILDIFVDAGWPEAHRLTYRLEEIYR